jgi:hypothetical protein
LEDKVMALEQKDIDVINKFFGYTILWDAYTGPASDKVRRAVLALIGEYSRLKKLVGSIDG